MTESQPLRKAVPSELDAPLLGETGVSDGFQPAAPDSRVPSALAASTPAPACMTGQKSLQEQITENRNNLLKTENKGPTIVKDYMLKPILRHTSHLIYAPEDAVRQLLLFLGSVNPFEDGIGETWSRIWGFFKRKARDPFFWVFAMFVAIGIAMFVTKGTSIKCLLQDVFMGWAEWNRAATIPVRFISICVMMILRLLVSNVLPFTSPAFAYLIAKSQPDNLEWQGTFYLLVCSMPAGLVIPIMDYVFSLCFKPEDSEDNSYRFRATECMSRLTDYLPFSFWVRPYFMEPAFFAVIEAQQQRDERLRQEKIKFEASLRESQDVEDPKRQNSLEGPRGSLIPDQDALLEILGKASMALPGNTSPNAPQTPYLERVASDSRLSQSTDPVVQDQRCKSAATAAVLAGHFMIWAGPATTMYQRKFVPDWWTCTIIQPLGLMEDVAVILATWAGVSLTSRRHAEVSLLGFMAVMNVVDYFCIEEVKDEKERNWLKQARKGLYDIIEHAIVFVLTIITACIRGQCLWPFDDSYASCSWPMTPSDNTTVVDLVASPQACAAMHTNVSAIIGTLAWVSFLALIFHILASLLTFWVAALHFWSGNAHAEKKQVAEVRDLEPNKKWLMSQGVTTFTKVYHTQALQVVEALAYTNKNGDFVRNKVLQRSEMKHEKTAHWAQSMVAGPAVKLAFLSNCFIWSSFIILPVWTYPLCSCETHGLANYPALQVTSMMVFLLMAFPMRWELACLRRLLPAQMFIRDTFSPAPQPPRLLGVSISVRMFLVLNVSLSFMGHLDLITNGLFLAKAVKTHSSQCQPDAVLEAFNGVFVQGSSYWSWLKGTPLDHIVLFACFVMVIQFPVGLARSVPKRKDWARYNLEMNNRNESGPYKFFCTYSTIMDKTTHHEEALFMLADSGRMPSLKFFAWDCMDCSPFDAGHYFKELVKTVSKFSIFTLMETMIFMHIQATSLGLGRCLSPYHVVDIQLAASTWLSIVNTFLTWVMTSISVRKMYNRLSSIDAEKTKADLTEENKRFMEKAKRMRHVLLLVYVILSFIFLVFLGWGAVKLYMNSTSCNCGWNFKGFPLKNGCVNDIKFED